MIRVLPRATPCGGAAPLQDATPLPGATLILRARGYAKTCATKQEARQLERLADRLEAIFEAQRQLKRRLFNHGANYRHES